MRTAEDRYLTKVEYLLDDLNTVLDNTFSYDSTDNLSVQQTKAKHNSRQIEKALKMLQDLN